MSVSFKRTREYWHSYTAPAMSLKGRVKIILANPGDQIVLLHCLINELPQIPLLKWTLRRLYSYLRYKYGIDLPLELRFGDRLRVFHYGGVIVNPATVIGHDVVIMHQVTIGNNMISNQCPVISDRCFLGVGSKVIGDVYLAPGTKVGAGAVVIHSSHAEDQTLVGVPARPVKRTGAKS